MIRVVALLLMVVMGSLPEPVRVRLPEACTLVTVPTSISDGAMRLERWTANCSGGLPGHEVGIDGLERTLI